MDTPVVVKPAVVKPKMGKNTRIFYAVVALIVLLFVGGILFALAETGMVVVPFFSSFYHPPQPIRVVTSLPIEVSQLQRDLEQQTLIEGQANPQTSVYALSIPEEELTGVAESSISALFRGQGWKTEVVQVAIESDFIEVYGRFTRGFLHEDVILHAVPSVTPDGLSFAVTSMHVGAYPVAPSMVKTALSFAFARDLAHWSFTLSHFSLSDVKLSPGQMTLMLRVLQP